MSRLLPAESGCTAPSSQQVLHDLLVDEHAAVYAYGVVGAHLSTVRRRDARTAFDAHRAARDDLQARLVRLRATPPAALLAYDVRARTQPEALAVAVRLEEGLAVRWHDLVAVSSDPALRRLGTAQLRACAVRAAQWRQEAGLRPVSAFPGQG